MSRWDGINRRKFPRAFFPCMVVVKQDSEQGEQPILTHTQNVGVGGICVLLKKSLKPFSEVALELDFLDLREHLRCKGRIVWSVQHRSPKSQKVQLYEIGIEFERLDAKQQQHLGETIRRIVQNSHNQE